MSDESEFLDGESDESCFLSFLRLFFLSRLFLFDLLELMSFGELDLLDDESDDDGFGSGSPSPWSSQFFYYKYIVSVGESVSPAHGVVSGIFVPKEIKSIGDVVPLVVFYQKESSQKVVDS